jgi:hypothetical protein
MIEGLGLVTTTGEYTPTYPYMGIIKIIYYFIKIIYFTKK